jgi:hypothetical protein
MLHRVLPRSLTKEPQVKIQLLSHAQGQGSCSESPWPVQIITGKMLGRGHCPTHWTNTVDAALPAGLKTPKPRPSPLSSWPPVPGSLTSNTLLPTSHPDAHSFYSRGEGVLQGARQACAAYKNKVIF